MRRPTQKWVVTYACQHCGDHDEWIIWGDMKSDVVASLTPKLHTCSKRTIAQQNRRFQGIALPVSIIEAAP